MEEMFGRYHIQAKLGQGGMGVVYRAFDTVLERVVALKLVLTPEELDPEMRLRFFREARAAGHLTHKNVVTIYDLGEHDGKPYLVMEYLDGEDLQRRLARPEKMSLSHKLRLAVEICEGVEYAHVHGIIHRDLKPANIYIMESGGAKILDFGLARLVTSQLTRSNMYMGTLNYMAPEQVRGERADQRSDVFSVGVVLYELLGGRKAFEGDSVASTLYKILQEEPEPLGKIDPALPSELAAIVARALAKLRDERYPDITTLRRDLEAYRAVRHASGPTTPLPLPLAAPSAAIPERVAVPPEAPTGVISPGIGPGSGSGPPPVHHHDSGSRLSGRTVATAAVAVLVVAAGAWFAAGRFRQPESASKAAATVAPAEDPVAARLRGAQEALAARQYSAASSAAEAVLLQAPQNAEAQRIRDAARRAGIDDALQRGSNHLKNGETGDAIKAAGEALALAPDNAAARYILEQAGTRTSGPDAETARRRMTEGRAAAEAAGARTLAASAYNRALQAGQDADRLSRAKRFADAAARYYEASGLYHGAEVAARTAGSALEAAATRQVPPPPPAPEPSSAVPQVIQPAPVAQAPAAPPVAAPVPSPAAATPPPVVVPSPVSPAVPTPDTTQQPAADDRINELIGRYKEALEARSFDQLKRLWPSLSGAAETAMRQEFQHAARITVEIGEPQISVSGSSGKVTFTRKYSLVTVEGQRLQSTTLAAMDVKRTGNTWVIDAIRFSSR